jgi:integrase
MPKKNVPNYRLHKKSGQAFVELSGNRIYLGKYGSKASRVEYDRLLAEWLANGRKAPQVTPSQTTCRELALAFLDWAKEYHALQPKTQGHCKTAMKFLVKYCGKQYVDTITPAVLLQLQTHLVEHGYARKSVNRYIGLIKQSFDRGVLLGLVEGNTVYALRVVKNLKMGRTKAHEYRKVKPVPDDVVEKTIPYMPPIIADMVRVQRWSGMRPQDVRNLRPCDIDRSRTDGIWLYRPYQHKTQYLGHTLVKAIGQRAQAILLPYLAAKQDTPEAFVFSPKESMSRLRTEQRKNRKTLNKRLFGDKVPCFQAFCELSR